MLRSPALVVLALAALFVPAAGAHTRARPSTPARTLHHEGADGVVASRRDHRTKAPASRAAVSRVSRTKRADRISRRPATLARANRPSRDQRRISRSDRTIEVSQPAHFSHREPGRMRREARQAPQTPDAGRSATPRDFLDAASATEPVRNHSAVYPPPPRRAAAQPVSVVSIIRRSADHPQLQPIPEAAAAPLVLPELPNDRLHHGVYAPLYGSHEILVHQNQMADRDGLDRILNDDDLMDKRRDHQLVPIPESAALRVDERLPANRRFCRPWVAQFLAELAEAHYARFGTPLQVNSAVRTVEFQQKLLHHNGNAAPAEGDTASPHLTGQAVDIGKRWMPLAEISWLRGYLLPLIESGRVDVEEEFQQACFHISAYRAAAPVSAPGSPGRYVAETPGAPAAGAWSAATR